jgi:hypothetical protein
VRRQEEETEAEFEARLAFTLAAALDKRGQHRQAWEALLKANQQEYPKHEQAYHRHRARMDAVRAAARQQPAPPLHSDARGDEPLSVFIIGASRSGKTTLERLVAQLEGVKRGFERRLIEPASRRASQLSGLLTIGDVAELPKSLESRFREFYLQDLQEFAAGARIVTDTHPAMIVSVGRVAAAIPKARFIFVKRNVFDIALRIFMKLYRSGNHYAYDIRTIVEHLSWYYEMIDLWRAKIPEITLCVDYEEMIGRPQTTLLRLAELCGAVSPDSPLPELGDDRGCSGPYREFIEAALGAVSARMNRDD